MNFIPYIITAASIVGTVANSLQKRWCFYVWLCTNSFWCIYNVANGSYAQALLYAFNFAMAILGLIKWRKNRKKERFIKCAECGGRATEFHHKRKFVPEGAVETDVERLCNIKPLCARCHRAEHEKERRDTEGKK